jgi:hypothetical protein
MLNISSFPSTEIYSPIHLPIQIIIWSSFFVGSLNNSIVVSLDSGGFFQRLFLGLALGLNYLDRMRIFIGIPPLNRHKKAPQFEVLFLNLNLFSACDFKDFFSRFKILGVRLIHF